MKDLETTLTMLMNQWNIVNAMPDDNKRTRHLVRLEAWIIQVQESIDAIGNKKVATG